MMVAGDDDDGASNFADDRNDDHAATDGSDGERENLNVLLMIQNVDNP